MTKQDPDCAIVQMYLKILESEVDHKMKIELMNEVRKLIPAEQNRWTLRWVIWLLGLTVLLVPVFALVQLWSMHGQVDQPEIPTALLSVASTALGALAAFLTHYTRRASEPSADQGARRPPANEAPHGGAVVATQL